MHKGDRLLPLALQKVFEPLRLGDPKEGGLERAKQRALEAGHQQAATRRFQQLQQRGNRTGNLQ